MCRRCVFVHRSSRLGAKVAVLDDKVLCGDGISANWTLELAKAVHQCDGVMPHSLKSSRLCRYDSELKLPPPFVWQAWGMRSASIPSNRLEGP
jgi:hypothetical protein